MKLLATQMVHVALGRGSVLLTMTVPVYLYVGTMRELATHPPTAWIQMTAVALTAIVAAALPAQMGVVPLTLLAEKETVIVIWIPTAWGI